MYRSSGDVAVADPLNAVRGLTKKSSGLRNWILIHSTGNEIILDVNKYTIMHRAHIHARDLRILDPVFSYPSTILGRERAIVLNLEHIKAIITHEEVLIRDPLDENVIPIVEELRRRFKQVYGKEEDEDVKKVAVQNDVEKGEENESPFEFQALEIVLEAICSHLSARTIELETEVYLALDMLTSKISSINLDRVRKLKSQMTRLTTRVQKVRDELEQLLDNEDDMADLYLSRKLADASLVNVLDGVTSSAISFRISKISRTSVVDMHEDGNDVEDLEMLLESYFMQIDGTFNKLATLREYIDNTEDYINIQLDNHRNQLIQLELFLNAGNFALMLHSYVSALLGMNIPTVWGGDDDSYAYTFKWVVIIMTLACAFVFVLIIAYARHKGLVGS